MRLNKPKFWDTKNSFISILLFPISLLVLIFIFFKKKFTKSIKFKIPIICVGNIYIGGTGKTPTSIFLAKELVKLGRNPVIMRKYYKNHKDEHYMIKENFENLILNKNRAIGVAEAEKANYDSVILDDGLQDYKINKSLNIVCFNQNQLIGNGLVMPSGPLRENLSSLIGADIILINGERNSDFEKRVLSINKSLKIFYSFYKPKNIDQFKDQNFFAVAGIGNPKNFFKLIEEYNLNVTKKIIYPDHYEFSKTEIQKIIDEAKNKDCKVIMTEKDYFRIKDFNIDDIEYLKISMEIVKKKEFINIINKLYDEKN
jgi:tetraacyldisaccharide 4'-kinase